MTAEFDAAMLARLRASKTEASRVVLDLHAGGRRIADAIPDAVESMPWRKTVQLRRWTENWKAFLDWMALQEKGWRIVDVTHNRVFANAPQHGDWVKNGRYRSEQEGKALNDAVAAGADVAGAKFMSWETFTKYKPAVTAIYEVMK